MIFLTKIMIIRNDNYYIWVIYKLVLVLLVVAHEREGEREFRRKLF